MYIPIVKPTRCINVSNLLYWSNTLHVSYSLSVHHQEFDCTYSKRHLSKRYCCLLASGYQLASSQQYLFDKCLFLYVCLELLMMDAKTIQNM